MRKLMLVLSAVVMTSSVALADDMAKPAAAPAAKPAAKPKAHKAKSMMMKGEVVSVDAATGTVTVKDKKGVESKDMVTADTKITKGGKAAAIGDLMAGDMVTVTCMGEGADMKCTGIKIMPAKKAKK